MNKSIFLLQISMLAGSILVGQTQNIDNKFSKIEDLRKGYHFHEAIKQTRELLTECSDSNYHKILYAQIAQCENGIKMLEYASRPKVVGSAILPISDFYLYYSEMNDSSWAYVPKTLNKFAKSSSFPNAIYLRGGEAKYFFSAQDKNGNWDIFFTQLVDGENWSSPEPLSDSVNSYGDEIFPFISADGKDLYFSSNGHYGVGGYDLYVSHWDENTKDWGTAQNLGFPYSSPFDDFLYVNTDDGNYTYMASNRDVPNNDSIRVYKLEYDNSPIKKPVTEISDVVLISKLEAVKALSPASNEDKKVLKTSPEADEYTKLVVELRRIQSLIDSCLKDISMKRAMYSSLTIPDDKKLIEKKIGEGELLLIELQETLRIANLNVQKRELDFLNKGMLIPRNDFFQTSTINNPSQPSIFDYNPIKFSMGKFPNIKILEPLTIFDYSFRIEDNSAVVVENAYPSGLVYRVQLFLLSKKADNKLLRGVSPIFESRVSSGKYLYSAGQFYKYEEAVKALHRIKKEGITGALVIAFEDGKSINLKTARILEQKISLEKRFQVRIDSYSDGLPSLILELIKKSSDKDISKKINNGKSIFFVGPFTNKTDAEHIVSLLKDAGVENINVEDIVNEPEVSEEKPLINQK